MRTSTALALGGAYAAYNLGQMEPEARARFVESIVGTAADAFKRFAEDPVGGLKRLWAEKSKSPILFLVGVVRITNLLDLIILITAGVGEHHFEGVDNPYSLNPYCIITP